jgi:hypothetical protein
MPNREDLNQFAIAVGTALSMRLNVVSLELLGIQVVRGREEVEDEYLLIGEARRRITGETVAFRHRFEATIKNTTQDSIADYVTKLQKEIMDYFYSDNRDRIITLH